MKNKKYNRFKQPKSSCKHCGGKGFIIHEIDFGFSDKIRCGCSMRETKKYKSILLDYDITVGEQMRLLKQFEDNNEHCGTDVHEGRSW